VQVHPIKHKLKVPGTKRLKLKYDKLPSSFAFNCNLRPYRLKLTPLLPAFDITSIPGFAMGLKFGMDLLKPIIAHPAAVDIPLAGAYTRSVVSST